MPTRLGAMCRAAVLAVFLTQTAAPAAAPPGGEPVTGAYARIGEGRAQSYARFDANGAPAALGIAFSRAGAQHPPTAMTDGHNCFDRDGDGTVDRARECHMWHEWAIPLPSAAAGREDVPFKWVLLNWNPHGHIPPGVWDRPHFDVHFYIDDIADVFAIEPGTCGIEFVDCTQFERGVAPVPGNYLPAGFANVDAVAPSMGNHLIDPASPEFGGEPFTRTWIYGVYDGRITFWEAMLTQDYLLSRPDVCDPIKTPAAVAQSGYYPTQYCVRHRPGADEYTVSIEAFVYRKAEPPGAPRDLPAPPPPPE